MYKDLVQVLFSSFSLDVIPAMEQERNFEVCTVTNFCGARRMHYLPCQWMILFTCLQSLTAARIVEEQKLSEIAKYLRLVKLCVGTCTCRL